MSGSTILDRPGPDSLVWQRMADDRMILLGGATLVLQVAHPAVGAGVAQHSNFKAEPWRRLYGTLVSLTTIVYGSHEQALAEVERLRDMHRSIRGVDDAGVRYAALQPAPWAWVHGTLAWHVITANELFGTPFSVTEKQQYWSEWLDVGRLLGVRDGDLPATWDEFHTAIAAAARTELRDNVSVRDVVAAISAVPPPRWLRPIGPLWAFALRPAGRLARLVTIGALPPELGDALDLHLADGEVRSLGRFVRLLAVLRRMVPPPLRPGPAALLIQWRSRRRWRGLTSSTA